MQSDNTPYLARLDHIRFFAAAIVVLFHTVLMTPQDSHYKFYLLPIIHEGHTGVHLFMVISGMILAMISLDKEIIISRFYLNRTLRIYPLFIFIVTLSYYSTQDPRATSVGIDYVMSLLPISNMYRLQYGNFGGHLWTIAVELQFYILFPFIVIFRRKYGISYLVGLILFDTLLRCAIKAGPADTIHQMTYFSIFGNLDVFLIGMCTGEIYMTLLTKQGWWRDRWVLPTYFVSLNLIFYAIFSNHAFFHVDSYGVSPDGISHSAMWIIWPAIDGILWSVFILLYLQSNLYIYFSRFITTCGRYSYSIYVWHIFVIYLCTSHFHWLNPLAMGIVVIRPVTILLSAASFHLIEKPFLELRVKYTT